ncbi:MAG: ankyrin repeat domain-containing protein [Chloroflexi bacterium]|nr:ankyrin repeat domain-containing protein [Chloroflexota bacterium]MCY3938834.1 ankyrin repeat domain-containing protein [Chloroflexota bacterium]
MKAPRSDIDAATLKLAARGDLEAVERLVARDPGVVKKTSGGHNRSLLWEAARGGHRELVEFLTERGADVNAPGRYRNETLVLVTPYVMAKTRGHDDLAGYLLAQGAVIDIWSSAYLGDLDRLSELLDERPELLNAEHPADPAWRVTPLHYSIAGGRREAAEFLIARGADVRGRGRWLLGFALHFGRGALAQLLLDNGLPAADIPVSGRMLVEHREIAELLLARGASVNMGGEDANPAYNSGQMGGGWPPIVYESRGDKGNHPERIRALLEHGAEPNAIGPRGVTALHAAAKAGFHEVIEVLAESGANLNALSGNGDTPLIVGVRSGRTESVRALLTAGANPNLPDRKGATPLTISRRSRRSQADDIAGLIGEHGGRTG